jgi:hypothetical protein
MSTQILSCPHVSCFFTFLILLGSLIGLPLSHLAESRASLDILALDIAENPEMPGLAINDLQIDGAIETIWMQPLWMQPQPGLGFQDLLAEIPA